MTQTTYFDKVSHSFYYHDLRPLQDDKTILKNPHKGWYVHFVDNGFAAGEYRDRIQPGDYLERFPGINHLYLRPDWSDLEPEEGRYAWHLIDDILNEWGPKGFQFTLRLCTYEGNGYIRYATPKWVFDAGAKYYTITNTWSFNTQEGFLYGKGQNMEDALIEPVYNDPIYCEKLDNFMAVFAARYDNDPRIESIDVGTYGTWGEGHTYGGSDLVYPYETAKWHIDLHHKYFRNTRILVNDDTLDGVKDNGPDACVKLAEYCVLHGMGMCDDSILVEMYCNNMGYDTLRSPYLYDIFWEKAPIDLEFAHNLLVTDDQFCGGLRALEAMRRAHATYAGFHGDIYKWYDKANYFHDYAANRLGYWYFVEGFTMPPLRTDFTAISEWTFENRGFAPAYHRYDIKVALRNGEGKMYVISTGDNSNRYFVYGEKNNVRISLDLSGVPAGDYTVCIGMFYGDRPIKLGISPDRFADGYYLTDTITVEP